MTGSEVVVVVVVIVVVVVVVVVVVPQLGLPWGSNFFCAKEPVAIVQLSPEIARGCILQPEIAGS